MPSLPSTQVPDIAGLLREYAGVLEDDVPNRERLLLALLKSASLTQYADPSRVQSAVDEELQAIKAALIRELGQLQEGGDKEAERLARLIHPCDPSSDRLPAALLRHQTLVAARASDSQARLGNVVARTLNQYRQVHERLLWLLKGTPHRALGKLDPLGDSDQICHALFSAFRVEARVAETLAINRITTWESASLFIRSTQQAELNSVSRFFDTYALFSNYFEWGEASLRGSQTVARINQIHGRYYIPNEGMKYILLNAVFTWIEAVERIGHRQLLEVERGGLFHGYIKLGMAMHIQELSHNEREMRAWFDAFNEANARHSPHKTDAFETIVRNSLADAEFPELADFLFLATRVGMTEPYRVALGYDAPTQGERDAVRAIFFTLGSAAEHLPGAAFIRSLFGTPARRGYTRPTELGVSERSEALPRLREAEANAGYPQDLKPVHPSAPPPPPLVPVLSWAEINAHAHDQSAWVVIDGFVYDLTAWMNHHPGGRDILLAWAGKDATDAFAAAPHTPATEVFRLNFRIGRLAEEAGS